MTSELEKLREKALKETREALKFCSGDIWTEYFTAGFDAAIAALPGLVKPLVWTPTTIKGEHLRDTARDVTGRLCYDVGVAEGHHYLLIALPHGGLDSRGNYPSIKEAKAAAQAHHVAQVLAAIDLEVPECTGC